MQQTSHVFSGEFSAVGQGRICRDTLYSRAGKRFFDIALVLLAAPIVLPIVAVFWMAARFGGRPGIYGQERVGLNGRTFMCWKIRTMSENADALLERHLAGNPVLAREWQLNQKLKDDPRITRLGRFLRRTSLDELPQFWNVLAGDMSLIGPRPFTPDQKRLYDEEPLAETYYRVRPGISGLWQVSSRNNSTFKDRVNYDHVYGTRITLGKDLSILFRTLAVVFRATGK